MQWKKLGLALLVLPFLAGNVMADDVDDEIKRLEKEKKRLELKKEVESMQNGESKKETQKSAFEAKMQEAVEKSQKPRDPNDFSYKNGGIGGIGLGYMMGSLNFKPDSTQFPGSASEYKYDGSGLAINLMAGNTSYFSKHHGIRYYFDAYMGFGGDSYDFSNTYRSRDKSWLLVYMGGSLDYLFDITSLKVMNDNWDLGVFAGVSVGVGMHMPYSYYYDYSSYSGGDYGYTYANSFWGLGYGFQAGVAILQAKDKASGVEIGYKYRNSGGSASWKEAYKDSVMNHSTGIIYANYIYRL